MSALATVRPPGDFADAPVLPEIAISAVQDSGTAENSTPRFVRLEVRFDPAQFGHACERREGSLYLGPGAARRVAAAVERALGRGCRVTQPEHPAASAPRAAANLRYLLTAREKEVLQLLAAGSTARESSTQLGISPRTVEFHRENIKEKLGVRSIAELTRMAIDSGLAPTILH